MAEAQDAPPDTGDKSAIKVIKRYANRKLYDTERSCYVTLEEIAQMVKEGEDVQVVDNKSKDDLTAVTLAQIIVEEEKKGSRMPLKLLRNIIKSSNEALGDFYQKRVADPAKHLAHDVEKKVGGIFTRKEGAEGEAAEDAEGLEAVAASDPGAAAPTDVEGQAVGEDGAEGPVRAFVTSTGEAFEAWQRRIDEQVKETLSKMTHLTQGSTELDSLKGRVKELEARLRSLEGGKGE